MLTVSGCIGIYYGFFAKQKQDNTEEYILGSKQMKVLPIAASMISGHISGITMLAVPADVYANGIQYVMSFIPMIIIALALNYLYLPVFYELGYASSFTYLEKRFDRKVKITASLVYALDRILILPIIMYAPALALNQVSGLNVHYICVAICVLCIFYTTVGGFRAVVWTDAIQFISMVGSVLAVLCFGTKAVGGFGQVFESAERGNRLNFLELTPNPLVRSSIWTISFGLTTMWLAQKSTSQNTIQKCLSLPSIEKAKTCVWLFSIGTVLLKTCSCYIGILMYSVYEHCDPFSTGIVKKLDQMLPYFTMTIAKDAFGLPGLFIAGIFSAALATMSSSLNALAGTLFEDIIKPYTSDFSEKARSNVMKGIVVCLGVVTILLVFVIERLGSIMHLGYSLHGLTSGALLALFTVGMLSRTVNAKGIIAGSTVSMIVVGIILVGAQSNPKQPPLPFSNDQCPEALLNSTLHMAQVWQKQGAKHVEIFWLFRISFMYYSLIGFLASALVAYVVSKFTGGCEDIDERLLAPYIRRGGNNEDKFSGKYEYNTVEFALKKVAVNGDDIEKEHKEAESK